MLENPHLMHENPFLLLRRYRISNDCAHFVEDRNPHAARRIAAEILDGIENLSRFPDIGLPVNRAPDPDRIRDLFIGSYTVRYLREKKLNHHTSCLAWQRIRERFVNATPVNRSRVTVTHLIVRRPG